MTSDYRDIKTLTENIQERIQHTTAAFESQAKFFQENVNPTAEVQYTTEEVKQKASELENTMKWMQAELARKY